MALHLHKDYPLNFKAGFMESYGMLTVKPTGTFSKPLYGVIASKEMADIHGMFQVSTWA